MSDTIDLPKIGPVKKLPLFLIVGGGIAFVGWRYYQARGAASADVAEPTDPGMEDGGTIPSVSGAYTGQSVGLADGSSTSGDTSTYGFTGTTNSQWTQYASTQLTQSDSWTYTEILTALGNYLNNKPLTTSQQAIVQAAIAVAGYPPEGSHTIIPGGDTAITVAPTGVKVTSTTTTTATLSWNAVAGAAGYRLYRSGVSQVAGVANGTTGEIGGLTPNTSYSFQVAAFTGSGQIGPKSSAATGKTKAVTLTKPTGLKATNVTKSTITMTCAKVANADRYGWYVNGIAHGSSDAPTYTIVGLKPKTRYSISVAADTTTGAPGPRSGAIYVTTKSK